MLCSASLAVSGGPSMTTKLRIGMTLSVIFLLVGLALLLGAPALATAWDSVGPSDWAGTHQVRRQMVQSLGIVCIGGGLMLATATLLGWHAHTRPIPRQVHP